MPSKKSAAAYAASRGPFDVTPLKRVATFMRALRANRDASWVTKVVSKLGGPAEQGAVRLEQDDREMRAFVAGAFSPKAHSVHRRRLRELARGNFDDDESSWCSVLVSLRDDEARPCGYFGVRIGCEAQASREICGGVAMEALTVTLSFQLLDAVLALEAPEVAARWWMDEVLVLLLTGACKHLVLAASLTVEAPHKLTMTRVRVRAEGLGGFPGDDDGLSRVLQKAQNAWEQQRDWTRKKSGVFHVKQVKVETALSDAVDLSDPQAVRDRRFSRPGRQVELNDVDVKQLRVHDVIQNVPDSPLDEAAERRLLDDVRAAQLALEQATAQFVKTAQQLPAGMRCWLRGVDKASPVIVYAHRPDGSLLACFPGTLRLTLVDPAQLYTRNDPKAHLPRSK